MKTILEKATSSLETTSFRDALGVVAKVLSESKNFNQEVYLITDAQASQFAGIEATDSTDLFDDRVRMFLVQAGGKQQENAGVSELDLKTQIISKNKPVNMQAAVRNLGTTPLRNSIMSVYVDGSRVVQQSLDIGAMGSATANFTVVPKRRGILPGYVQLEDDALESDNRRYFVLTIPANINILMIGETPQDTRLASLALTLGGDSSLAGLFSVQQATSAQLSSLDINKFDVLVFCGVKAFTPTEADRVAQFVRAGGGVMLFPDDETDIANLNATVFAKLNIPASQPAQEGTAAIPESFLSFAKMDNDHPLFQGLFEQPSGGKKPSGIIESPRVFKAIRPQAGEKGHTIISLSDGTGFLTEYMAGEGRLLLFSVEANLGWSDFPVKGLFAPLLHRATVYLASRNESRSSTVVGERIRLSPRVRGTGGKELYAFKSPVGIEERVVPHKSTLAGTAVFESAPATEVGVYELRKAQETIGASAVNLDPDESDLRHVTDDQLQSFWKRVGITDSQANRVPATEKIETTILESRLGVELWKYFLTFAIIVALVEMAVARESKSTAVRSEA